MKIKFIYAILFIAAMALTTSACQDMLDTDSDRHSFEGDNSLDTPDASLYSVMGILSQLQKLGDRYVLFGELRGDLMTVSSNAPIALKEINDFDISPENAYIEKYDYYSIINNCNYAITKMDTSVVSHNEKVMIPQYAAIKAIRAWTYFQMVQIYGSVYYVEEPILNLEGALAQYPVVEIDDLADLLIKDLFPYRDINPLTYGNIDGFTSLYFFVPIKMLLGDLYLLQNKYEQAAIMYHDLIYENHIPFLSDLSNYWVNTSQDNAIKNHINSYSNECIMAIPYGSSIKDYHSNLVKMSYDNNPVILPVQSFLDKMSLAPHFHAVNRTSSITGYFEGDLRGSIYSPKLRTEIGDAFNTSVQTETGSQALITKFANVSNSSLILPPSNSSSYLNSLRFVSVYSVSQLYLRYAEAVNRLGKPTLAFSVLKYGLNMANITNPNKVNPAEIRNMESYMDFSVNRADYDNNNVSTASRGRGLGIDKDQTIFVIPDYTNQGDMQKALQDSINWVELQILDEMAAETAFDGSRFFDLLRFSRRRDRHPEFMADKVSAKYDSPSEMKNRLMNIDKWFVK